MFAFCNVQSLFNSSNNCSLPRSITALSHQQLSCWLHAARRSMAKNRKMQVEQGDQKYRNKHRCIINLHVASVSHDRATSVCICPSHKSAYPFDAWAKRVDLSRGQLSIAGIARTPAAEGLAISIAEPKWHTIPLRSQGHISNCWICRYLMVQILFDATRSCLLRGLYSGSQCRNDSGHRFEWPGQP